MMFEDSTDEQLEQMLDEPHNLYDENVGCIPCRADAELQRRAKLAKEMR